MSEKMQMTVEELKREIKYASAFHTKEAIQQALATFIRKIEKYGVKS